MSVGVIVGSYHRDICVAQRLSSGAFDATPAFAAAKVGGGPNVTCSDLLAFNLTAATCQNETFPYATTLSAKTRFCSQQARKPIAQ